MNDNNEILKHDHGATFTSGSASEPYHHTEFAELEEPVCLAASDLGIFRSSGERSFSMVGNQLSRDPNCRRNSRSTRNSGDALSTPFRIGDRYLLVSGVLSTQDPISR